MAGSAVVDRSRPWWRGNKAFDDARGDRWRIAEHHHDPVVRGQRFYAEPEGLGHSLLPGLTHDRLHAAEVDALANQVGVGTEHHDDRIDRLYGGHRVDRVLEQ